jgi:hypothetical protein
MTDAADGMGKNQAMRTAPAGVAAAKLAATSFSPHPSPSTAGDSAGDTARWVEW